MDSEERGGGRGAGWGESPPPHPNLGVGGRVAAAEIEHSNLVYLLPGNTISQYA